MLMLMYYWVSWVSQQSLDSLRLGPRLQTLQLRVSPRLQKIPDDQKSFYGCKRKRSSSGLSAEAREKKAKVVFVEDIVCRSDAGLGHNSGSALVDGLSKSTARVKRTLKMKYRIFTLPLAVFIVLSGKYEDDDDNSEEVVYTGHGGNDLLGYKCQMKDQVMCCGNLALKNNMDQDVPVIVICGHKCASSNTLKVYTYDGLYKIEHSVKLPLISKA